MLWYMGEQYLEDYDIIDSHFPGSVRHMRFECEISASNMQWFRVRSNNGHCRVIRFLTPTEEKGISKVPVEISHGISY